MRINKVALAVTALLAASQVQAAGFQVSEHSASGLGRAFAGEAAIGDNAASLARNPALMATFDKAQLSVVGSYVSPDIDVTSAVGNADDVAPSQIVPAMYYIQPINDQWAAGLAIYSNYGVGTEYPDTYMAGSAAGTTSIMSVNFNPNISYRVNEQLSLGAGVSLVYASAELQRNAGVTVKHPVTGDTLLSPSDSLADMEGDGYGFGWNVGALYEVNENNRFGISYKSKVKTELEGEYKGTSSTGVTGPRSLVAPQKTVDGELDVNLPSILEVSGYHKLSDKFAVSYSWQYSTWSDFGDIVATSTDSADCNDGIAQGQCLLKEEDYSDSSRYAIGGEYYLSEAITIRAGYAFDEQAGKSTLSIPDTDRNWYTAGVTYKASPALSFDFAAALVAGKEITFDETIPAMNNTSASFTSSGDAYIYSAQMNYSF